MSASLAEADEILFRSLKQGGIRVPSAVTAVAGMTGDHLVGLVSACVEVVSEGKTKLPGRLPPAMGARHRNCSRLAAAVIDLGYGRSFAYNNLLYPSANDTRDVLQWLAGRLPRGDEGEGPEEADATPEGRFRSAARAAVDAWRSGPEPAAQPALELCRRRALEAAAARGDAPRATVLAASAELPPLRSVAVSPAVPLGRHAGCRRVRAGALLNAASVRRGRSAAGSVAAGSAEEASARLDALSREHFAAASAPGSSSSGAGWAAGVGGGLSGSAGGGGFAGLSLGRLVASVRASRVDLGRNAFLLSAEFAQERAEAAADAGGGGAGAEAEGEGADRAKTDEEVAAERAAELEGEEGRKRGADGRTGRARAGRAAAEGRILAAVDRLAELAEEAALQESEAALQGRALELAEGDAASAEAAARGDVASRRERLEGLAGEWERHRGPLADAVAALRGRAAVAEVRAEELEGEAASLRADVRRLDAAAGDCREEGMALHRRVAALPEGAPSRGDYVERILGIVGQCRRQEEEERGIEADVGRVQAETGRLSQALGRARRSTQELLFAEMEKSRRSDPHRRAAESFTALQEAFASLLGAIRETAAAESGLRDVSRRVEQLRQRAAERNRDDVIRDLKQLKTENATMEAALREAGVTA